MRSVCQAFGRSRGVQRFLKQGNKGHEKEIPAIDNKHHGFPCTSHHEINSWILSWTLSVCASHAHWGEWFRHGPGGCVQFLKMMMYQVPICTNHVKVEKVITVSWQLNVTFWDFDAIFHLKKETSNYWKFLKDGTLNILDSLQLKVMSVQTRPWGDLFKVWWFILGAESTSRGCSDAHELQSWIQNDQRIWKENHGQTKGKNTNLCYSHWFVVIYLVKVEKLQERWRKTSFCWQHGTVSTMSCAGHPRGILSENS